MLDLQPAALAGLGVGQVTEPEARELCRGLTTSVNLRCLHYDVNAYFTFSHSYSSDDSERTPSGHILEVAGCELDRVAREEDSLPMTACGANGECMDTAP